MALTAPDTALSGFPATAIFDRAGRHLTVYLSGELDAAATPPVEADAGEQLQPSDEHIWMEMSAVTFIDSTGIRMLFRLHDRVEASGGRFTIDNPSGTVGRVLEMCGASGVLSVRS